MKVFLYFLYFNEYNDSIKLLIQILLDSLASSIVSGPETPTNDFVLSNSEVYSNHATEADDLTYYKKRRRYHRLGLVRVFSRGKKKSVELKGKKGKSMSVPQNYHNHGGF